MAGQPLSLYIHVPFCSLKCAYCDFNSYAKLEELVPAFVEALFSEIRLWAPLVEGRPVETVSFGGGTPTLLPPGDNARLLSAIGDAFDVSPGIEISIEANPGTVDLDHLRRLRTAGFNRISFGVQSFHDDDLAFLDRIHSARDAGECVAWAREAGFERINIDLIYGLPDQTVDTWSDNIERALQLDPGHLSMYALTVEDGTRLAYDVSRGLIPEPDPDLQADMYERGCERMSDSGYTQYEISNWARPGKECRHNLVYWRNREWLGLGPGAHSHWGSHRFAAVYSPRRYIELLNDALAASGATPRDVLASMPHITLVEEQPPELQAADTAILALRLNDGLDLAAFKQRFGRGFTELYAIPYEEMVAASMLERVNGTVRLTDKGRFLANEVFVRLLPD